MAAYSQTSTAPRRGELQTEVREQAAAIGAGALAGLVWVGLVGRLAMRLIAMLNPEARGLRSDDDFVIGQFTASGSLNLAVFGLVLGALGGALYLSLRGLRIGPHWFQLLSVSLAPAVVALGMLVNPDGVDFTVLEPAALSLVLFLLVTWGYTLSVVILTDRWLPPGGPMQTASPGMLVLALLPALPVAPVVLLLAAVRSALRRFGPVHPVGPWLLRAGLLVLFVLALVDLAGKVGAIV